MTPVGIIIGVVAVILSLTAALLFAHLREQDRLQLRIDEVQRRASLLPDPLTTRSIGRLLRPVEALGALIARSGLLSVRTLFELEQTLQTAGLRGRTGLSLFVGGKLLLAACLPGAVFVVLREAGWWPAVWPMIVGSAAIAGLLLPDLLIRRRRKAYLRALDQGLPDALDMLVICSEAGLGLEAAFERVGDEIGHGHPVIASEMRTTLQEMRINADRRSALIGLGQRTGLESLRRLGSTLVQTMQFGTPLSQALRTLSAEMRQEMLIRFEGRAARLPVLLTLPMILFILPCVFLVVGGPALVQIFSTFQK